MVSPWGTFCDKDKQKRSTRCKQNTYTHIRTHTRTHTTHTHAPPHPHTPTHTHAWGRGALRNDSSKDMGPHCFRGVDGVGGPLAPWAKNPEPLGARMRVGVVGWVGGGWGIARLRLSRVRISSLGAVSREGERLRGLSSLVAGPVYLWTEFSNGPDSLMDRILWWTGFCGRPVPEFAGQPAVKHAAQTAGKTRGS